MSSQSAAFAMIALLVIAALYVVGLHGMGYGDDALKSGGALVALWIVAALLDRLGVWP